MKAILAVAAVALMFCAGVAKAENTLEGNWKLVAGEANGQPLAAEQLEGSELTIRGDEYVVKLGPREPLTGTQMLDWTVRPYRIDIVDSNGAREGQTSLGIFELDGDEFRISLAPPGKPRPEAFSTSAESGNWIHVWKRVKE